MNFLELADYLVAGFALLTGIGVGKSMRPKPPEPLRPICSCDDGFGSHLEEGGCQAMKLVKIDQNGKKRLQPCPCVRYDGPDPSIFGLG